MLPFESLNIAQPPQGSFRGVWVIDTDLLEPDGSFSWTSSTSKDDAGGATGLFVRRPWGGL